MADFGLGSLATGRLEAWENWNASTQVSMHYKLSCEIRGGAFNTTGPTAGPYWEGSIGGGHAGSGYWTYASNGWRTLREFDVTFNKDANGNIGIGIYGHINGKNSPYVTANSVSWDHYPARIGIAPAMNNPVASNVSVVTATISGSNINNGLGTSTTIYLRYKKTSDPDASYVQQLGSTWNLTGLTPATQYSFQVYGHNNNGDTAGWINTQTFTTLPAPAINTALLRVTGVM